jgi:ATP-binding cassette subfamily B protein
MGAEIASVPVDQQWEHRSDRRMELQECRGIIWLRLFQSAELVGSWPATSRRVAAAHRFVATYNECQIADGVTSCDENSREFTRDEEPQTGTTRSLLRLGTFAKRNRGSLAAGIVLTLLATAFSLIPPYLTMPLIDRVLVPWQNGQEVPLRVPAFYLGLLFTAAIVAWMLGWARTYVVAWFSETLSADLRNTTYAHLQRLSVDFFTGKRTGDLISRISSDTDRICFFLSVHLLDFVTDILMISMTAVILLSIHPTLACATLIPLPAIFWLVQWVRGRLRHGFAHAGHAWADMVSVLTDAVPGIRVVKAFAQEQREIDRFGAANARVVDFNMRVNRLWSFFGPTVGLLTEIGVLVIWATGAWMVASGEVTVGVLTAFFAYMSRFYTRLDSMSRILASTQRAAASAHRVFELLDQRPSVPEHSDPIIPMGLQGRIVCHQVSFRYGTRTVLDGIDLEIAPGELIGLVGPSGSGKSTLANLVCRFYDPTSGSITVDGVDVRRYAMEAYRRNLGLVLQEPFLFFGSIAENIAYGRCDATRAEIVAAARAAHAHDFIMRLPDAYDSMVGERGQTLSGGERQRISIARAILTDPRILILDEATSAVDNETEREIQAALENLIRGRTTIAIAHRLSTLHNADRIIVLDQGRIVEVGRHLELLEKNGVYARLHLAQFADSKDAPADELAELRQREVPV